MRDKTGITQVVFNDKIPQELFEQGRLPEKRICGGQSRERSQQKENRRTLIFRPAISRSSQTIMILYSKADTPPIYIKDDDNVDDNLRLKYRYLDLRKEEDAGQPDFPSQPDETGQRLFRRKRIYRSQKHRC